MTFEVSKGISIGLGAVVSGGGSFVVPANSYARIYTRASTNSGSAGFSIGNVTIFSIVNTTASVIEPFLIAPAGATVTWSAVGDPSVGLIGGSASILTIYQIFKNAST